MVIISEMELGFKILSMSTFIMFCSANKKYHGTISRSKKVKNKIKKSQNMDSPRPG